MNPLIQKITFHLWRWFRIGLSHCRKSHMCLRGMKVGSGTQLPALSTVWPHQVSFGKDCVLEPDSTFKFDGVWMPGPRIIIGDEVFIGRDCEFNIRVKISIGSHGLIASGCKFIDHDHGFSRRDELIRHQSDGCEAAIVIEDNVWIGANSIILKGVTIQQGAIVAAGSIVTKSIGPLEIWGGVPAKKLRDRP